MGYLKKIIVGSIVKLKSRQQVRDKQVWIFGEWFGKQCGDNSTYLANYIANTYREIHVYWIANKETDVSALSSKIKILERNSKEAMQKLKIAGVAFVGQNYHDFTSEGYNYVSGAITVLLWHGIPWKKIGHDGATRTGLVYELYIRCLDWIQGQEYYLSTSNKYTDIMKTAYRAKEKQIIKAGYPRNQILYNEKAILQKRNQIIDRINQKWNKKFEKDIKIITYMPTFRLTEGEKFSFYNISDNIAFNNLLLKENAIILQKMHFVNQEREMRESTIESDRIFDITDVTAQELLCATDLLITDYSGCFFDFLLLDRPIIHYLYDYEYYKNKDRGLYYEKEEVVAGSVAESEEELVEAIKINIQDPKLFSERRKLIREKYLEYESRDSCEIIYQEIKKKLM